MPNSRIVISSGEVNRYGYRILPEGISLENYKKNPVLLSHHNTYAYPIRRMTDLQVINGQLTGIPEFDLEGAEGKEADRLYKAGLLSACSLSHRPIELSESPEHILPGQTRATVTKCDLQEISMVSVPADAGATRLSKDDNQTIDDIIPMLSAPEGKSVEHNLNENMDEIFEALGLEDNSANKAEAVKAVKALKTQLAASEQYAMAELIKRGEDAGVINADNKSVYESLSYTQAKSMVDANIKSFGKKEGEQPVPADNQLSLVKAVKQAMQSGKTDGQVEETFESLSKNNPKKLLDLKVNDPEKYEALADAYINKV